MVASIFWNGSKVEQTRFLPANLHKQHDAAANIRTVHGTELAERPRLAWSDPRLYGMLLAVVEALMLWTVSSTMDTVWTLMLSSCLAVWLHP
jgi:hypothetical protein